MLSKFEAGTLEAYREWLARDDLVFPEGLSLDWVNVKVSGEELIRTLVLKYDEPKDFVYETWDHDLLCEVLASLLTEGGAVPENEEFIEGLARLFDVNTHQFVVVENSVHGYTLRIKRGEQYFRFRPERKPNTQH